MQQAIQFWLKGKNAAARTEHDHKCSRSQPNRQVNIEDQPAHTRASYGDYGRVTTLSLRPRRQQPG